ncbi:sulfotransferase family 2 domain-containing protein [Blastomonas aquatica]|uniref:Sulfotransferase family protein n=1 Tax=Blastomonas aquatica TaxID=1510276 RepID=A0ABQ1JUD5_9SPHN|nr:sulfotransferase family 2 domain-containing protein [Blastomonas aquatica]GGB75520.1 hypothetical protein GCM10010833_33430 [Blastomonas aquatica]
MVHRFDNRLSLSNGKTHLSFELGGKLISYAYIRKNACKTFKIALGFENGADIREVSKAFPDRKGAHHDATIFVYRDPIERIMSLYRNKILEKKQNQDIMRSITSNLGVDEIDFETFITFCRLKVDPHTWSQRSHLKRINYTHAIKMDYLYEAMVSIVGAEHAAPFKQKNNSSTPVDITISQDSLSILHKIYADDFKMIKNIEKKDR